MSQFRRLVTEIHRRSLWQVLGVYALASWVIYQVVLALWEGIGLPSWVPGTALVLLLIGLPIVLATAFVQEGAPGLRGEERPRTVEGLETSADSLKAPRRAGDEGVLGASELAGHRALAGPTPTTSTATPSTEPLGGTLFTWRKALAGGVLAFATLGLVASGFMGMRALGIGPAATLISSGQLAGGTRVLVADFHAPPADSLTAFALAETVRIDLAQAEALSVVDPAEVGPALARMKRPPDTRLTEPVALELAVREGIPAVLVGELTPVGSGYQIVTRLIRADSSRVLLHVRERAAGPDHVLAAMDRLTDRLLERTGESLRSIRAAGALEAYTTSSLEALKLYSQAQRATIVEHEYSRAEELLEGALRQDSTFAMAWRKLGVVRNHLGDRTGAVAAFRKAFDTGGRLPELERAFAAAGYYSYVEYDPDKVVGAYERMLELDSSHWGAYNNLAIAYERIGDFGRAAGMLIRAVAVDSAPLPLGNLALRALATGDTALAAVALEARRRLYPDNGSNPAIARDLLYARDEIPRLRTQIDRLLASEPRAAVRQSALYDRALLEFRDGRIRAGTRTFEERRSERLQGGLRAGGTLMNLAYIHLTATGDTATARAILERYVREVMAQEPPLDRAYLPLASAYALLGDLERARAALADWEGAVPEALRRRDARAHDLARGLLALAEGREDEALERLRAAADRTDAAYIHRFFLARAYDHLDRPDSAIAAYRRWDDTRHWNRLFADAAFLAPAYERLGALYEERGDRSEAAEYYGRFVDLWADADPELQPRVEAARRALARLSREGGA